MSDKSFLKMVKVMPIHNSVSAYRTAPRALVAALASAFLLLCAAGTAHAAAQEASDDGLLSMVFSTYGITVILLLMLAGLVVYKKLRARQETSQMATTRSQGRNSRSDHNYSSASAAAPRETAMLEERRVERRVQSLQPAQQWEKPVEVEPSVYGAYRIDQEVGKLVLGKPHRMDVMASRAADDRRAIEASLVKVLEAADMDEDGHRRARQALEEYGFVARQSAMMLMGRDAWERSSAARTLGQIGSKSSLSYLIEALHDADSVVRNQAISSLGALKMPAAIGALLDIARRHPDIPASLLSETLSSCSVESLGYLDSPSAEPMMLGDGTAADFADESLVNFEDLPDGSEDQTLENLLAQLGSSDEQVRSDVAQQLGLHPVQRSVAALSSLALTDLDSAVRAAAVVSLGSIDHESVFAPVLIALSDETREVRAAAARTLTSLHFDRAEAYVRVMEKAEPETLRDVARACIKIGIVSQTADRLASEDRRQAYEAFSLFSLLAKANETEPILETIRNHKDTEVRLSAIRVLSVAAGPDVVSKLRDLVAVEGMPENVRTAMLEVLYRLDQKQTVFDLTTSDNDAVTLHNSL
jgi:HEAT repeat protein